MIVVAIGVCEDSSILVTTTVIVVGSCFACWMVVSAGCIIGSVVASICCGPYIGAPFMVEM